MAGHLALTAVLLATAYAGTDRRTLAINDAAHSVANVASGIAADDSCLQGDVGCGLGLLQTAGTRAGAAGTAAEEEEEAQSRSMVVDFAVLDDFLLRMNSSKPKHSKPKHSSKKSDAEEKADAEGDLCMTSAELQRLAPDPESVISAYNYAKPETWAKLDDSKLCNIGPAQSPININTFTTVKIPGKLDYAYEALTKRTVINTGHNLQIPGEFGTLTMPDWGTFNAVQFHVHAPSEHTINGKFAAMELHMVHLPAGTNTGAAVVGIFFDIGFIANACIEKMLGSGIPNMGCERPIGKVDFDECFKEQLAGPFWNYRGSLTTPPCTEGVQFNLMTRKATMTMDQYIRFKKFAYGNPANNRPTQPVNGRVIYLNQPPRP